MNRFDHAFDLVTSFGTTLMYSCVILGLVMHYQHCNVSALANDEKQMKPKPSKRTIENGSDKLTPGEKLDIKLLKDAQKNYDLMERKVLNHQATIQQAIPAINHLLFLGIYNSGKKDTLQSMSNLIKFAISDTSVTDLDKLTLGLILARYKDVCNQTNDLNLIADVFLSIEKSHREKIFRENIDIYSIVASFNDTLKSKNLNEKADQLMNKDDYPFR